ncbi:hypothetical protein BpHYR1_016529 [Brachionus plicatilis]|uniref:Uncharacterized protein n=1 Tax=Brachionus plicatilis TaxID=10195 RepID=A0A3M7R7A0_BRAPC|nr:hypothetical protein BpHYR1_016529 [Brachionus plicatilis]
MTYNYSTFEHNDINTFLEFFNLASMVLVLYSINPNFDIVPRVVVTISLFNEDVSKCTQSGSSYDPKKKNFYSHMIFVTHVRVKGLKFSLKSPISAILKKSKNLIETLWRPCKAKVPQLSRALSVGRTNSECTLLQADQGPVVNKL